LIFDGAEGKRRGEEHIAILLAAEERGMCTNITVAHRTVIVTTGKWIDGRA
jgi:hypothetical protein